jgi:CheY-like chemotaxis protein/HPt (histidine-containing phosphotransfer) domain-containing protein
MHGSIGVTSVPEHGSTFWFAVDLPAAAAPVMPARVIVQAMARRILVVDDNAINQIVAKALLEKDGHVVSLASDGAQAVEAVQAGEFDLVLMDMQMPVMDGLEASRRIRALDAPLCNIPIVALSANAMADQVAQCCEAGMNDHLAKPIDRNLLRKAIATWATPWDPQVPPPLPELNIQQTYSDGADVLEIRADIMLDLFYGYGAAVAAILNSAAESTSVDAQSTMETAGRSRDVAIVIAAARRLRGASGNLRANRLMEIASLIERNPQQDSWMVTPSLLAELRSTVDALSAEIESRPKPNAVRG